MQTTKPSPIKISTEPPGKLVVKKWEEISPRTKITALAAILAGATVITALLQAGFSRGIYLNPADPKGSANVVVEPPLTGIATNADSLTVVQHLKERMPEYEHYMVSVSDETLRVLVLQEAARLNESAKKEASTGQINIVDPTSTLDLKGCITKMDAWRCVLFRYAAEGLSMINRGIASDNAMLYSNGRIRFTAALIAQYPIPFEPADQSSVLHAHKNYLEGASRLVELMPSGKSPFLGVAPVTPATVASPYENIRDNNPSELK